MRKRRGIPEKNLMITGLADYTTNIAINSPETGHETDDEDPLFEALFARHKKETTPCE